MSIASFLIQKQQLTIPVTLLDPFTNTIFEDPVTLKTGETVSLKTLEKNGWTHPETKEKIGKDEVNPNQQAKEHVIEFVIKEMQKFFKTLSNKSANEQIEAILAMLPFLHKEHNTTINSEAKKLIISHFEQQTSRKTSNPFVEEIKQFTHQEQYKLIVSLINANFQQTVLQLFEAIPELLEGFPVNNQNLMEKLKLVNNYDPNLIDKFIQILVSNKNYNKLEQYFSYGIPSLSADKYYEKTIEQIDEEHELSTNFCEHFINLIHDYLLLSTKTKDEISRWTNILLRNCLPVLLSTDNITTSNEDKLCEMLHKMTFIFASAPPDLCVTSDVFTKELLYVSCFSQVDISSKVTQYSQKLISILLQRFKHIDDGRINFGNVENKLSRIISYSIQYPFSLLAQLNSKFAETDMKKHIDLVTEALNSRLLWETKLAILEKFVEIYYDKNSLRIPAAPDLIISLIKGLRMFPPNMIPIILLVFEIISRSIDNKKLIGAKGVIQRILEIMHFFDDNYQIQISAIRALSEIANLSADNRSILAKFNGVILVLRAMKKFRGDSQLQAVSCFTLWVVSISDENRTIIVDNKGIQAILKSMKLHPRSQDLQANACGALWNIALNDPSKLIISQNNGIRLIVVAMFNHKLDSKVQKYACGALGNLVTIEENAQELKTKEMIEHLNWILEEFPQNDLIKQATRLLDKINPK
ncbi:protein aardvark [Anaeramoeba ignava]|uniref:RING-type E3 ubiquitin transferase n=1 Tax=Anaeramoeba ignava TaxID=1746090 RepID=A0A9Q0LML2_ANAIG|nr:protein aardvark [Anaeramoeba ignava]|eukprot:Anaeramoba_ignava/a92012_126.p1 GENE.a92012_126~~a92012_126.p1  ORF type:complete len:698 (-),score=166.77 a92012_126:52-2145(-)